MCLAGGWQLGVHVLTLTASREKLLCAFLPPGVRKLIGSGSSVLAATSPSADPDLCLCLAFKY